MLAFIYDHSLHSSTVLQFYKHIVLAISVTQRGYDLFVHLIVNLALPTEIVPHLNWDRTVAKQHKKPFPAC